MNNVTPLDTRSPGYVSRESPVNETPSTMRTTSTTSSTDVGRTLAFAVAERVLEELDGEDGDVTVRRLDCGWDDRVLLADTTSPWSMKTFSMVPATSQPTSPTHGTMIVNLNTPPMPADAFPKPAPSSTSSKMRATAPAFAPVHHTPSARPAHARTQSELLPPVDITPSSASSTAHRRAVSTSPSPSSSGGVPLPRKTSPRNPRAGMPTLAEITAHYRTIGRKPSVKDLGDIAARDTMTASSSSPRTATQQAKRYSLDSADSGTTRASWSSSSSSASDDEPRTPPDARRRACSVTPGGSRLPSFLRDRSSSTGDRNALAEALAKHASGGHRRYGSTASAPESKQCTPGIQVTPPSTTMESPPSFPKRSPQEESYFPRPANGSRRPTTSQLTTTTPSDLPAFSFTPPTAAAQGVSPLARLEAQLVEEEVRKRRERAERMVRLLGKRTGGVVV